MKDLKNELIELSITNLIQCLEENNQKDNFIKIIPDKQYSKIVSLMREESTIIQMRDFHNWIKSLLIKNITNFYYSQKRNERVALLDIAVGRGGDLMKWKGAFITDVFAFDINFESIYSKNVENPGALERLNNLKNYNVNVEFAVGDAVQPLGYNNIPNIDSLINNYLIKSKLKQFDLVSCQFALHYYFSSEVALRNMLSLVSKYLKPGGYFFGTTIDGDKIKNYLEGNKKIFKRTIYKIERMYPSRLKSPFGNKYTFTIFDNKDKTNYFNTIPVSVEYLTDLNILRLIAKQYSLEPVDLNFFEKYGNKYTNNNNNNIQFEDIYRLGSWKPKDSSKQITPEQLELSFLNSTFVFRKI
jgi:mRNA (guanine-N7-)-methyltransferase